MGKGERIQAPDEYARIGEGARKGLVMGIEGEEASGRVVWRRQGTVGWVVDTGRDDCHAPWGGRGWRGTGG